MEFPQKRPVAGCAIANPGRQKRVRNQALAQHDGGNLGIPALDLCKVLGSDDAAVEADWVLAPGHGPVEPFRPYRVAVKIPAHPGVDDQFLDGIAIIDLKNFFKLRRVLQAQPGLDRHRTWRFTINRIQKPVQVVRIGQQSGPLSLGRHGAGGAACIEIDRFIAHSAQLPRRPEKILRRTGENLRHRGHIPIVFRRKFPQIPGRQLMDRRGGKKRRIIPVHTGEQLVMQPPECRAGNALQGRKVQIHTIDSFWLVRLGRRVMPPAAHSFLSAREKSGEKRALIGVRACTACGLGKRLVW